MKSKIHSMVVLNHLLVLYGLIFSDWSLMQIAIAGLTGVFLFGKIGGEIGYHRYFSHESFDVNRTFKLLFLYLGSLNFFGSVITWVLVHRAHHQNADKPLDPHNAKFPFKTWLTLWDTKSISKKGMRELLEDDDIVWFHQNYWKIVLGSFFILAWWNFYLSIFLFSLPAIMTFHSAGLVNTICHTFGYRNFETRDQSRNNLFVNFVTLGSGLHNNHHAYPADYSNKKRWFEIDLMALIIRLVKA